MTPLSSQQVLEQVLALNTPEAIGSYDTSSGQIVGSWNYNSSAKGALESAHVDMTYKVTFTLDEATHAYSYIENTGSQQNQTSLNPLTGKVEMGGSSSMFKGQQFGDKTASFNLSFGGKPGENTTSYSFSSKDVKNPVFALLASTGWTETKKGFLKSLFGK